MHIFKFQIKRPALNVFWEEFEDLRIAVSLGVAEGTRVAGSLRVAKSLRVAEGLGVVRSLGKTECSPFFQTNVKFHTHN